MPSSSVAQDDGVYVDPDSPAGKEYAVPLDEARRNSGSKESGDGGRKGATEYGSDAFGDGIENEDGGASPDDARDSNGSDDAPETDDPNADDPERTAESTPVVSDSDDGDDGGLSGGAITIGLLLLVVGGGALLAYFLRRGGTSQTA